MTIAGAVITKGEQAGVTLKIKIEKKFGKVN
jgi:hypothetical protein